MKKRIVFIVSLLVIVLATATALHAFSIDARYGPSYSYYQLTEGEGEYHEVATWNSLSIRSTLPLGNTFNVFTEVHSGETNDVDVVYGATASDQNGSIHRYIIGAEFSWRSNNLYALGGGAGYIVDEHTHTWVARHPGGPGTPPFSPNETLNWTWERSVKGALVLGSVHLTLGWLDIEGRLGYSPSALWEETTEARLDDDWEKWQPEETEGILALYEVQGKIPLGAGLSLRAGAQGVSMQSAKAATYDLDYTNSDGLSFGHTANDLPAAQDHMISVQVGVQYSF